MCTCRVHPIFSSRFSQFCNIFVVSKFGANPFFRPFTRVKGRMSSFSPVDKMKNVGDTHLAWGRHSRFYTYRILILYRIVTTFPCRWERQTEPSSSTWTYIVPHKRDYKRVPGNVLLCFSKTNQNNNCLLFFFWYFWPCNFKKSYLSCYLQYHIKLYIIGKGKN